MGGMMADIKIVIGSKDGKSYQKIIEDKSNFIGRKIGDKIKGDLFGMTGYEFLITGGSDDCGFPMRKGFDSTGKKKILALGGVGIKNKKGKGVYLRKTIAGIVISDKTTQLNLKVLNEGKKKLEEIFLKKEENENKD